MYPDILEKAKNIKLMIFDVDGVLTSGKLVYGPTGLEYKEFNVQDGQGIKYLKKSGVEIAIITACKSQAVKERMQDLGIQYVYQGCLEKTAAFLDLKKTLNLNNHEIAYLGDDFPDLPIIMQVGLGMTVPFAPPIIQKHAHYITKLSGGEGAAREVCDLIMKAQGSYETLINKHIANNNF